MLSALDSVGGRLFGLSRKRQDRRAKGLATSPSLHHRSEPLVNPRVLAVATRRLEPVWFQRRVRACATRVPSLYARLWTNGMLGTSAALRFALDPQLAAAPPVPHGLDQSSRNFEKTEGTRGFASLYSSSSAMLGAEMGFRLLAAGTIQTWTDGEMGLGRAGSRISPLRGLKPTPYSDTGAWGFRRAVSNS